jgi:uncharacterized protein YcgL (UPF0745 family)
MRQTKSKILDLYLELEKNTEKFIQQIIVRGFERIGIGSYKSVYSKKKLGYVIKVANSLNDEFANVPSEIKNYYIKPYYIDEKIVIQKKANTKSSKDNYKKILNKLGINICERLDINPQNCGAIDNSPIIFDFCEV